MTWVKLGEERVNTDTVVCYYVAANGTGVVARFTNGEERVYWDPDGALLRALDEACGLGEPITIACSVCGHAVNVRGLVVERAQQEGIDYEIGEREC